MSLSSFGTFHGKKVKKNGEMSDHGLNEMKDGGRGMSESFLLRRLMVMPRSCKTTEGDIKYVGIFVQCNPDATDTPLVEPFYATRVPFEQRLSCSGWLVTATANISLVNLLDPKKAISKGQSQES